MPSFTCRPGGRIPVERFDLPEAKIRSGYYSAAYFNRAQQVARACGVGGDVTMQVFQRNKGAVVCGVDEAIAILKVGVGRFRGASWVSQWHEVEVSALRDGDTVDAWETVLKIKGDYDKFANLESLYLGALARGTRIASNTARCVEAADGKPILFFADRFDYFGTQERDGYAAVVGGASAVATDAMGAWTMTDGSGTMPHALIACFNGGTAEAAWHFNNQYPNVDTIALVDFNNDCVTDSIRTLRLLGEDLKGVRLDTSGTMVDQSIATHADPLYGTKAMGDFDPRGVNPVLVQNVRDALDANDGKHVKIYVSGGFTPEKIAAFTADGVPVDGYGVGSSLLRGSYDYTADIVAPVAKAGRRFRPSCRLSMVA